MMVREKAKAQVEFLRLLYNLPLSHELIFRGSTAIHGIFVGPYYRRFGGDLDFVADRTLVQKFKDCPSGFGLPLEKHQRPDGTFAVVYPYASSVLPRLLLPIDVCEPYANNLPFVPAQFHVFGTKERIPVHSVMSYPQMVAEKLTALLNRSKATDFVDVWLALRTRTLEPSAVREAFLLCAAPMKFRASEALRNLDSLEAEWVESLRPTLLIPVPDFQEVRRDLAMMLSEVE